MSDVKAQYQQKKITLEQLVKRFAPHDYVQLGVWYGEPYGVIRALHEFGAEIEILHVGMNIATAPSHYLNHPGIRAYTGFLGTQERAALAKNGNIHYTPMQFTDAARWVREGAAFKYLVHRVCPMDERGMFNFGMTSSWEYSAIRYIRENKVDVTVVFEVNPNMPRVPGLAEHGSNELSIDYCDLIVEDDSAMLDYPTPPPNEVEKGIAANVAPLVPDKATVQLGFGTIPMAIGKLLQERKELGIHTEMFCEAHIDLIESGSVTNAHKGLFDGKSACTFALGTKRLHNFMKENPDIAMLPVDLVNAPPQLAKVNKLHSINSVLTVDMTGQACAHCLAGQTYSGLGGAFEFASGSQMSPGGKSISCLPATAKLKDGTVVSNIVAQHPKGARITIPEHTVDWVVTEYGAVRLKFLPMEQRAEALIGIAHPDFREQLGRDMRAAGMRLELLEHMAPAPKQFYSTVKR